MFSSLSFLFALSVYCPREVDSRTSLYSTNFGAEKFPSLKIN